MMPVAKENAQSPTDVVQSLPVVQSPPMSAAEHLAEQLNAIDLNDPAALDRGTELLQRLAGIYQGPPEEVVFKNDQIEKNLSNAIKLAEIEVEGNLCGLALDARGGIVATASRKPNSDQVEVKVQRQGFNKEAATFSLEIRPIAASRDLVDVQFSADGSTLGVQTNKQTSIFKVAPDESGLPRFQGAPQVFEHSFGTAMLFSISGDGSQFLRIGKGQRDTSQVKYHLEYASVTPSGPTMCIDSEQPITSAIFTGDNNIIYSAKEISKVPAGMLNLFAKVFGDGTVEQLNTVLRRIDVTSDNNRVIFSEKNLPDLNLLSWQAGDRILALHSRGLLRIENGKADSLLSFRKEEITPELARAAGNTLVIAERKYTFQQIGYGSSGWHDGKQVSTVYNLDQSGEYAETGRCEDTSLRSALDQRAIGISGDGKVVALQGRSKSDNLVGIYRL